MTTSKQLMKYRKESLSMLINELESTVNGAVGNTEESSYNTQELSSLHTNSVNQKEDVDISKFMYSKNMELIRTLIDDLDKPPDVLIHLTAKDENSPVYTTNGCELVHSPCDNLETLMHDLKEFQIQHELRLKKNVDSLTGIVESTKISNGEADMSNIRRNQPGGLSQGRVQTRFPGSSTGVRKPAPASQDNSKCASCGEHITDQLVTALGKAWHYSHFVCSGCKSELARQNFYERDGAPYCEGCYQASFSPKCAYCNQPILDRCITALDKPWHPEHFFCQECTRPFDESSGFHEKDGKPFCGDCYNDAFAPKCAGCLKAITSNYINALDRQWHATCFVCRDCGSDFSSGNFYEVDGQPYCELHYHTRQGTVCISCKQPISGKCISAMGRKFHPEHFTCSFCNGELAKGTFLVKDEKPYCNDCYNKLFVTQ